MRVYLLERKDEERKSISLVGHGILLKEMFRPGKTDSQDNASQRKFPTCVQLALRLAIHLSWLALTFGRAQIKSTVYAWTLRLFANSRTSRTNLLVFFARALERHSEKSFETRAMQPEAHPVLSSGATQTNAMLISNKNQTINTQGPL